nr:uncharacterized protein LOC118054664 isoform X2 [Populus alba]
MGWVTLLYVSNPLVDLFSYHISGFRSEKRASCLIYVDRAVNKAGIFSTNKDDFWNHSYLTTDQSVRSWSMQPSALPIQILRVGQLAILSVPGDHYDVLIGKISSRMGQNLRKNA